MPETSRLFDVPEVPEQATLSRDQRLTVRRRELLAAGRHPLRGDPLTDVEDAICGNCKYLDAHGHNLRTYYKCGLRPHEVTFGAATDLRVSWPGCIAWEASDA